MPLSEEPGEEARDAFEKAAHSKDAKLRRAALRRLQQIGSGGVEPLLVLLQYHMRKRQRVRTMLTVFMWLLLPFSLLLMPGVLLSICLTGAWQYFMGALLVWGVNWLLFVLRSRVPMTTRQREIVEMFADINDLRAIGSLLDTLGPRPENDPPILRVTLTRLLKQVRASDNGLLSLKQRGVLYRELLQTKPDAVQIDFILALLKSLEQIGTTGAIPYVAQLAQRTYPRPAPPLLSDAAWRCLEFLREHATELKVRQTLLRASNIDNARPESLLRPAQEQSPSSSETLLRPDTILLPDMPSDADANNEN